jgi:hypothetical protein
MKGSEGMVNSKISYVVRFFAGFLTDNGKPGKWTKTFLHSCKL